MIRILRAQTLVILVSLALWNTSCNTITPKPKPKPKEVVKKPEDLNVTVPENITAILSYAAENNGVVDDSIRLIMQPLVDAWYQSRPANIRTWSEEKQWLPYADSLFQFIKQSELYGLFPSDYHYKQLQSIYSRMTSDSSAMLDAALWSRADVMFTDAFMKMVKDLKYGRLGRDSITLRKDSVLTPEFCHDYLNEILSANNLTVMMDSLEPKLKGYVALKNAIPKFLDSMDRTVYTYVVYPFADSMKFINQLQTRLFESSYITFNTRPADSAEMAAAIKKLQIAKGLKPDGIAGPQIVKILNDTDPERFKRIAINLDRYKLMADTLPTRYVWVNIPEFHMQVWDTDSLIFDSRIVVGQPPTRTPLLTSEISNFVTFPQWTVPYSIIFKEMLPKIQKNVDFLAKENLMVVDKNDSIIDPHKVNWKKLNKNYFPYLLKQRQGDDNSLGIMKFNFRNKYSVYMHDTNARGLFGRSNRALSHGCVRVQQWQKLAKYLIRNDTLTYRPDTLQAWLKRQEKHTVVLSQKLPVYIRYFTCAGNNGHIVFYDDVYGEDKFLREKYFGTK
ncbi:MAG: hypothetical protein C5B52_16050 [Bacteroidetes bacterium]|nr:MAG: hypothetical protein C5B52_16050 [Bacteroidota bacterium]